MITKSEQEKPRRWVQRKQEREMRSYFVYLFSVMVDDQIV